MSEIEQEALKLVDAGMGFAEQCLNRYGEFYPFGMVLCADGQHQHVAGFDGSEMPSSADLMDLIQAGFRQGASAGEYDATAMVFDARIKLPRTGENMDAIVVSLDHRAGISSKIYAPYRKSRKGILRKQHLEWEPVFSEDGANAVFDMK